MSDEQAIQWKYNLNLLYLLFGHLDRYFELAIEADPSPNNWSDANILI